MNKGKVDAKKPVPLSSNAPKKSSKDESQPAKKSAPVVVVEREFDMPGVSRIPISTITQRVVGCVVGENVTSENPWTYVQKETVEDNLELHEGSSEFLPIKKQILQYQEKEVLIGYDPSLEDEVEMFYVCYSTEAKDTILGMLEKQRAEIEERLKKSVQKIPGQWESLGSETDIEDSQIKNLRPLIEVEVESKYPLYDTKVKFSMRKVAAAVDGYIELLPGRFPYNNVARKRVDAATQASPYTRASEAQTNPTYPINMWTQYHYEYREKALDAKGTQHVLDFFDETMEELCDTIRVNEHINMYTNDYETLVRQRFERIEINSSEMANCHDVHRCKGKTVGSVTWNPIVSGILIVSYVTVAMNTIYTAKSTLDPVMGVVYGSNPVLMWSYDEPLRPKLFLESPREVYCVDFCPYNPNIVIGGCKNGQIIIWDITNKLEQVESREYLTPAQQRHRVVLYSMMKWMKSVKDVSIVKPTAISCIDYGHKLRVTDIVWLSPNMEITRNGKLQKVSKPGEHSCQFLSCSTDSTVYVWDLKAQPVAQPGATRPQRKSQRLKERPSALTINISPFKAFDKIFKPLYKLIVEDNRQILPLTNIAINYPTIQYTAINPETENDVLERTYYKMEIGVDTVEIKPEISASSSTGRYIKFIWEGYDFDQGQKINSEIAAVTTYESVHDGPIKTCIKSPFMQNIVLTVGGKVFAIWNEEDNSSRPLVWRKCKMRYVNGHWSSEHPSIIFLSRVDASYEIWNHLTRTSAPSRVINVSGNALMDTLSDPSKSHVRKNTVGAVDDTGALRIFQLPTFLNTHKQGELMLTKYMISRAKERRSRLVEWSERFRDKMRIKVPEPVPEAAVAPVRPKKEEPPQPEKEETVPQGSSYDIALNPKWRNKQEKIMFEILLEKAKINLAEVKVNKKPLEQFADEALARVMKQEEILSRKDQIFENAINLFFKETKIKKQRSIHVGYDQETVPAMKGAYMESYNETSERMLKLIKSKPYRYIFEWNKMISEGKERRKKISVYNYDENVRKLRYEQRGESRTSLAPVKNDKVSESAEPESNAETAEPEPSAPEVAEDQ